MPRRRNRNRNRPGYSNYTTRTLAEVEGSFKRMRVQRVGNYAGVLPRYIQCRQDPFSFGLGGSGRPDAALVPRIVVDHRDYSTLTIGTSGTCQVRLFPCLPIPLAFKPLGADFAGFAVNGTSVAASTAPTTTSSNTGWMPLIRLVEWATWSTTASSAALGVEVPGPYFEVKTRIVSLGVKVYYTGAASTAAGTITVTADRSVCPDISSSSKSIDTFNSTAAGFTSATAYFASLDFGGVTPVLDANTITERPEHALRIIPRRLDVIAPWLDRSQIPIMLVDGVSPTNVFTKHANGELPATALYDDLWEIPCITFTGVAPGSVYRFETAVCVEYQPMVTSTINKIAKKPTEVVGADTLSKVEAALTKEPIATDANATPTVAKVLEAARRPSVERPAYRTDDKKRPRKRTGVQPVRRVRPMDTNVKPIVQTTTTVKRVVPPQQQRRPK